MAKQKECSTSYGFGFWGIGDASPIGTMDAEYGVPSKQCPECGKGGEE